VATVTRLAWVEPKLLLEADLSGFLSQADLNALGTLRDNNGFWSNGNYYQNYLRIGLNERWFQDSNGNWFVIAAPVGNATTTQISRWNGGTSLTAVATVNALVYDAPELLFKATAGLTVNQTQLQALRLSFGFRFNNSFYQNYLGLNEKWIWSDIEAAWYIMRTDGRIHKWLGGKTLGTQVAKVSPLVWDNPNLLFTAPRGRDVGRPKQQLQQPR
jgi:hypothetical protein